MKQIFAKKKEGGPCAIPVSLSVIVECCASFCGAPRTKSGAVSKEAKGFQQFLRDLEKDYRWSILCSQEFTAACGEVVTETPEGHKVFATPPCKRQRRLAIVVAAETLPFMIGGSFYVKRRNCALDVFCEGKKFRVLCSHFFRV